MLSKWQLERLCALVYLDGLLKYGGLALNGIVTQIMENDFNDDSANPAEMGTKQWMDVLRSVNDDPMLNSLTIIKTVNDVSGFRAVAFRDGEGEVYAVFRGTSGDLEWLDNAQGMTQADTAQQQMALGFVSGLAQSRPVTVAGHSKGGNKAQYTAIAAPDGLIGRCVSVDGQGFSQEFINKYRANIDKRRDMITLMAERRDFVNCLGLYIYDDTEYYTGYRDGALPFFHCPDSLRKADGEPGDPAHTAAISAAINKLISHFLTDAYYTDATRASTSVGLISLLLKDEKNKTSPEETAEALTTLICAALDLAGQSDEFIVDVESIFENESETVLATIEYVKEQSTGEKKPKDGGTDIEKLLLERLALRVLTDAEVRRDFTASLSHIKRILKNQLAVEGAKKTAATYLLRFLEDLVTKLI
jgi:hypothetical protein